MHTSKIAIIASALLLMTDPVRATTSYVDVQYRQDAGTRPFVPVSMNGKTFLMMVHSGAILYMMTTHKNAASIGLDKLQQSGSYGITAPGHISTLGRGRAILPSLVVAGREQRDVPILVFEIPQETPTDGMLGLGWLRADRVILDFDAGRLGVPATPQDSTAEDNAFAARGYVAHKMIFDPKNGYYVRGTVNGIPARISVNTVMNNVLESAFAARAGIPLGPVVDEAGGPKGAVLPVHISKFPLSVTIDGQDTAATQPLSWDMAAYASEKPGTAFADLHLGTEFMLANQAIIDFGTETLFIPGKKGGF